MASDRRADQRWQGRLHGGLHRPPQGVRRSRRGAMVRRGRKTPSPDGGWNHRDIYLTHVDRDLGPGFGLTGKPFLASDIRRHMVLYSLLYEKLIVPDASTLYNREFE